MVAFIFLHLGLSTFLRVFCSLSDPCLQWYQRRTIFLVFLHKINCTVSISSRCSPHMSLVQTSELTVPSIAGVTVSWFISNHKLHHNNISQLSTISINRHWPLPYFNSLLTFVIVRITISVSRDSRLFVIQRRCIQNHPFLRIHRY